MFSNKAFWILITFLFGIFFIKSATFLDPDFGWHYRNGKTIVQSGIPKTDPYSYTMPSYQIIDHSWLLDVLIYWGQNLIGQNGLALVFTAVVILAIVTVIPTDLRRFSIFPLVLSFPVLVNRAGIRTQMFDWLLLVLLVKILKHKKVLPLFFLIWANLHGGFLVGFAVFAIYVFCEFWYDKKTLLLNISYFLLSIFATFITPYGWRMWYEVWTTISDPILKSNIIEWFPFWKALEFGFLLPSTFVFSIGWMYKGKIKLFEKFVCIFLFLAGLSALRHISLFILMVIPLSAYLMRCLYEQAQTIPFGKIRFKYLQSILLLIALTFSIWEIRGLEMTIKYPQNAINFLKNNLPKENLFAEFGWGGYLDWKLPEKKVFIDGRMNSWRFHTIPNESTWIFKDYMKVAYDGDYKEIFDKYQIDTVLLTKETLHSGIFVKKEKPYLKLITNLEKDGWKEIYSDEVALVLQKPI